MLRSAVPQNSKRIRMSGDVETANNHHFARPSQHRVESIASQSQVNGGSATTSSQLSATPTTFPKVPGRLVGVELQNFMCHTHLKLNFNVTHRNCYYIVGSNGSGKSAVFAGINIALGGKGRSNDRGNSLQAYIKEGQTSAKVRVILTNEGRNSLPEYGREIIIERTIMQTSSTYVIKSRRREGAAEEIKSRKKGDVDRILNRFSIELENPLSWLSQDRSRQFLQSMKPEKLYEIFMVSSDLEATKQIYDHITDYQEEAKGHVAAGEQKKIQLKDEYEKMLMRYKSGFKIEELSRRMSNIEWLLLWAEIRDRAEQIDAEKAKLEKLAAKRAEFEAVAISFADRKKALATEKDDLLQKVNNIGSELRDAKTSLTQHQSAHQRVELDIKSARDLIHRKQMELQSIDREINQTRKQLAELMGNSNRDLVAEQVELRREKEDYMKELEEISARNNEANEKLSQFEIMSKAKTKEYKAAEFRLKELNSELERIATDKQLYVSAQKNRLNLLGENILQVKRLLHANRGRFAQLPLGPIGEHVKMRDPKWARPVEFCLKNVLNNFICNSAADRKVFEQLCTQHRIKAPDLIITSYVNDKVDTSASEPSAELNTILRVIDVADPTVYNVLIDHMTIENTVLVESDEEARRLMRDNPPANVRQAFTLRCSHVYPRQENRPYRFYSNSNAPEARFLASDGMAELARRNFDAEHADCDNQIIQQKKLCEEYLRTATRAQEEFNSARNSCQTVELRQADVENALRQLDEKGQELQRMLSSGTIIENFKETLAENTETRLRIEEEIKKAKHNLRDCDDNKSRIDLELREAQECLKRIDVQSRNVDSRLNDNSARMDDLLEEENNCANKLAKCDQIRQKINDRIKSLMEERAFATERCVNEKGNHLQPDDYTDPPDFAQIPETETLKTQLREDNQRKAVQQQINRNDIPKIEEVEQLRELGKSQSKKLKEFRNYLKRFADALYLRRQKFELLQFSLPINLERTFKLQMLMRNYNGTLDVHHSQRTIMISVDTHKSSRQADTQPDDEENDANEADISASLPLKRRKFAASTPSRRNNQDLKGLSGGERSYTTACFVMALWDCAESPFRCLDEFDVFMDMLNRRVVMEMLVDYAMEHKDNQFFFFTPQGINELQSRDNIEIFELKIIDS